jgi:hypothetical protein
MVQPKNATLAGWGALPRLRARLPTLAPDLLARPRLLLLLVFGRFLPIRQLLTAVLRRAAPRNAASTAEDSVRLSDLDIPAIVDTVRQEGICTALRLPPDMVAEIRAYAETHTCYGGPGWNTPVEPPHTNATGPDGVRILAANLPDAYPDCPAVAHLVQQGVFHAIAAEYLGPSAQIIDVRLWWSFPAGDASRADLRRVAQDTFHFDLADWGQLKFFFYLTDVDAETGAHVYVRGSHARRPLSCQFTPFSAKRDDQIDALYGPASIQTVLGPAGTGFVEDVFGFHTGLAVRRDRRLVLEMSFGTTGLLRRRAYPAPSDRAYPAQSDAVPAPGPAA